MKQHSFFSATQSEEIPFNLVFDEDPPEGIVFKNNKIYVNTKDPSAYQKLHEAAITKYMEGQDSHVQDHLNNLLT